MPSQTALDLANELSKLKLMLKQLPESLGSLLLSQFDTALAALVARDKALCAFIHEHVEDAVLDVKYLEFDLNATREERNALQDRLDAKS